MSPAITEGPQMTGICSKILFIVGSPRSGTTWLQKILASSARFTSAQESDFFLSVAKPILDSYHLQLKKPSGRGGTGLPAYFTIPEIEKHIAQLFYNMIGRVDGVEEAEVFIEKTPSHALVVDLIHKVLPDAIFIHIVRNPFDVTSSMMSASRSWGKVWAPTNVYTASRMWKRHVRSAEASFEHIPTENKFTLKYEDLKQDTEKIIDEIRQHFSLPYGRDEIPFMIESANKMQLRVYGEFGLYSDGFEKEPAGFARKNDDPCHKRSRELNFLEKLFQLVYLFKEMTRYGYNA